MNPLNSNFDTALAGIENEITRLEGMLKVLKANHKDNLGAQNKNRGNRFSDISTGYLFLVQAEDPLTGMIKHLEKLIENKKTEHEQLIKLKQEIYEKHQELEKSNEINNRQYEKDLKEYKKIVEVSFMLPKIPDYKTCVNELYRISSKRVITPLILDAQRSHTSVAPQIGYNYYSNRKKFTPIRFTYADSPSEPIADSYIIYWLYDKKNPEKISTQAFKPDSKYKLMLPVGIGKTNSLGFLRTSLMQEENRIFLNIDKNQITVFHKPWYESINFHQFNKKYEKKYLQVFYGNFKKAYESPWTEDTRPESDLSLYDYYSLQNTPGRIKSRFGFQSDKEDEAVTDIIPIEESGKPLTDNGIVLSPQYFDPDASYGFLVFPANRGSFQTGDLNKLTQINIPAVNGCKAHKYATKTKPPGFGDNQAIKPIELHCTISEWAGRIEREVLNLQKYLELYESACTPHKSIKHYLQRMRQLTKLNINHPYTTQNKSNKNKILELDDYLNLFDQCIDNQMISPETGNKSGIREILGSLNSHAKKLWQLLQNESLRAEIEMYLNDCETALKDNPDTNPYSISPNLNREPYWWYIFQALETAYALLAKTSLAEEVWEKDVLPGMIAVADGEKVGEIRPSEKINTEDKNYKHDTQFKERIQLMQEETEIKKQSLLSTIFSHSRTAKSIMSLGVSTPGPSSALQVILDCYGNFVNNLIVNKRPNSIFHMKCLFGIMNFFNVFGEKKIDPDNTDIIIRAASGKGNLTLARRLVKQKWFSDFSEKCYQGMGSSGHDYAAKFLKTNLSILNIVLLTEQLIKRFEDSAKFNSTMTMLEFSELTLQFMNTAGEGAMCVHTTRLLLSKWKNANTLNEKTLLKFVAGEADKLAVFLGVIGTTIALVDAYKANEKDDFNQTALKLIEASGCFLSTFGYVIKKTGEKGIQKAIGKIVATTMGRAVSTAWVPVAGQYMVIAGAIVTIFQVSVEVIVPLVKPYFMKRFQPLINEIYTLWNQILSINENQLNMLYSDENSGISPFVVELFHLIDKTKDNTFNILSKDGIRWGTLTWRAAVPLFEMGYDIKTITKIVELPSDSKIDFRDHTSVEDIINYYKKIKKNPEATYVHGHSNKIIASKLLAGSFTPDRNNPESEIWNETHFFHKKELFGMEFPLLSEQLNSFNWD